MTSPLELLLDTSTIENKFIFNKEIQGINTISDNSGNILGFHRTESGNNVVFTKDGDGCDVAVEHTLDGGKIYHLSEDGKGLPAMHEFKPDGAENMYLFDEEGSLEKIVENKVNGDKLSTWFTGSYVVNQEQRQKDGTIFKITTSIGEAIIWLHLDGSVDSHGSKLDLKKLIAIFETQLDGVIL